MPPLQQQQPGPSWPGPGGPGGPGWAGGPAWPPGYWPPPPSRQRNRRRVALAILGGALLVASGIVASRAALNSQSAAGNTVVDHGVVDVNTTLGLQDVSAAGTGVILTSTGEVLTNNHVIRGATSITVTVVSTGSTYTADVVGYDIAADVAVLQLQGASGLATAHIGDSAALAVGDYVQAVGNVGGAGGVPTVADGSVTALDQTITATDESNQTSEELSGMIQTNASVRPGDSGGPLMNGGEVVGIDTAGSGGSDGFSIDGGQEAGFAIPIDTAVSVAQQIERHAGSSTIHIGPTAFLGVSVGADAGGAGGALVGSVVGGSPAEAAGIVSGDTITSIDGSSVGSPDGLADLLILTHPGQRVEVGWSDPDGTPQSANVRLASGPAA